MRVNFRRRALWLVVASVGALALAGGIAYATIPDNQGVIHGCRNNGSGILRVIDSANASCTAAETPLNWNQTGPQGVPGPSPFAGYHDGGNQQPVNCPPSYNPVSWGLIPPSGATDPPLVRSVQFNLGSPTGIIIDVFGDPGIYHFQLLCSNGAVPDYVAGSYLIP